MEFDSATEPTARPTFAQRVFSSHVGLLLSALVVMWVVEALDTFALSHRLQSNGIHPRELDGLDGVVWAPFLHSDWGHIGSNSVPFVVLGWLVALRGKTRLLLTTIVTMIVGGGLTWLVGGSGNHIGASGVVFGYFGALLGAAFYERRPATLAPALVAILLYGGMIAGLAPKTGISWEGHLFGLLSGVLAARVISGPRPPKAVEPDEFSLLDPDAA